MCYASPPEDEDGRRRCITNYVIEADTYFPKLVLAR